MADPAPLPPPSATELIDLESQVVEALARRDSSALSVVGFGEISVALGWPTADPRYVCKRLPPFDSPDFARYESLIERYVTGLRGRGVSVVDTWVRAVPRGEQRVAYLVQPMLAAETLGDRVLAATKPDAEHPFLSAVLDAVATVTDRLSLDAQVTNWSWDGDRSVLLDVGTPLMWDTTGRSELDIGPFLAMIPRPVRPLVRRDMTALLERWRTPRGVALDLIANLYREGHEPWVEPALAAANRRLGTSRNPLQAADARRLFDDDRKTWPRLKRLQVIQRAWRTRVRRRPYEFFIQSGFDGLLR